MNRAVTPDIHFNSLPDEPMSDIKLWLPLLAGFVIAMVAAIFGIGGGFLLVPFIVSVLGLPMYVAPATAAIPIFMGSSVSILNYLYLGAQPDYEVLQWLLPGCIAGALLGPGINHMTKESYLKITLAIVVALIGTKYLLP